MNWIKSLFTPKEQGGRGTAITNVEQTQQDFQIDKSPILNGIANLIKENPLYQINDTMKNLIPNAIKNELTAQGIKGIAITPDKEEITEEMKQELINKPTAKEEPTGEIKQDTNEENANNIPKLDYEENGNQLDYEKIMEKLWAREDEIRKETQEREDTAYQRAVEDMRKAGVNPNLVGINPANSGGGITQATNTMGSYSDIISSKTNMANALLNATTNKLIAQIQTDNTLNIKEMEIALNKYIADLQNDTTINENTKKNILSGLQSILQLGGNLAMFMMFKGKIK